MPNSAAMPAAMSIDRFASLCAVVPTAMNTPRFAGMHARRTPLQYQSFAKPALTRTGAAATEDA
jgi:hypothetical protein